MLQVICINIYLFLEFCCWYVDDFEETLKNEVKNMYQKYYLSTKKQTMHTNKMNVQLSIFGKSSQKPQQVNWSLLSISLTLKIK